MKKIGFILIATAIMAQTSFADQTLRGQEEDVIQTQENRRELSEAVPFSEDASKYLQYTKEVGSTSKPRVKAVGRGIFTGIFGGITYYLNANKGDAGEWSNFGLGAKAFAGFTAKCFWDLFDTLTFTLPYQDKWATQADGLVKK